MRNGKHLFYSIIVAGTLFAGINVAQAVFYTYPSISAPSGQNPNGQVLVGSSTGLYAPQATSTLFAPGTFSPFPFTPTTNYSTAVNSTSTPIWFTAGLMASSSSYFPGGIWNSSGNVGIGTTSPSANHRLAVNGRLWVTGLGGTNSNSIIGVPMTGNVGSAPNSGDMLIVATSTTYVPTGGIRAIVVGAYYNGPASSAGAVTQAFNANTGLSSGTTGNVTNTSGGGAVRGGRIQVFNNSTGYNLAMASGLSNICIHSGVLASTTYCASFTAESPTIDTGNILTTRTGLFIRGAAVTGTLTNNRGIDIEALTSGTNRHGIYQQGASDLNYFAGNTGIGTSSPFAKLSVHANNGETNLNLFAVGSSTATATTTHFRIENTGLVTIGSTTAPYGYLANDRVNVIDSRNDYSALNVYNIHNGACATADLTVANDQVTNFTNFGDLGHTSSGFTGIGCINNPFTGFDANSTYLFDPNGDINFALGSTTNANAVFKFFGGGYSADKENVRIMNNGRVGIGTTSPFARLSVHARAQNPETMLFTIASSTASATTTLFSISNIGTVTANGALNISGAITSTATSKNTFPYASTTALTISNYAFFNGTTTVGFDLGAKLNAYTTAPGTSGTTYGSILRQDSIPTSASTLTNVALQVQAQHHPVSTVGIDALTSIDSIILNGDTSTVGTSKGLNISLSANAGTLTNTYGLYVGDLTTGTQTNTPYSVYASDASTYNYFGGNVGIGTTTPGQKLSVAGDILGNNVIGSYFTSTSTTASTFAGIITSTATAANTFPYASTTALTVSGDAYFDNGTGIWNSSGNVGIGTTTPSHKLSIIAAQTDTPGEGLLSFATTVGGIGNQTFAFRQAVTTADLALDRQFSFTWATVLTVQRSSGNVGIGTTTPGQKLSVAGDILGNNIIGSYFTSTSTTASTFAGAITSTATAANTFPYASTTAITASGQFFGNTSDAVGTPAYSWGGDTTTGIYNSATGQVGIAGAGSQLANFKSGTTTLNIYATNTTLGEIRLGRVDSAVRYNTIKSMVGVTATDNFIDFNLHNLTAGSDYSSINSILMLLGNGRVGISSTTPLAKLSVHANNGETNLTVFAIASSTATATTTLFSINNIGNVGIGTSTPQALLNIKSGSASVAQMILDPSTAINAFFGYLGALWNDSTQNMLAYFNGNTMYIGGNIYTATAAQTITTATPTTAFSSTKVGTTTIAANSLRAGQKFSVWGSGFYSTPVGNTDTVTITTSIASSTGTVNISTVTTAIFPASATNLPFDFLLNCTVRSIGTAATAVCDGEFKYATALSGVAKTSNSLSTVGTFTFDSTVKETLDVKASWSVAATGQTATVQEAWIDF